VDKWEELATGESGDVELEKSWLRMAGIIFKIFCEKQHDYGYKNIAVGGLKGVVLRSGDKMSRLWELTGLADETLVDRVPVVDDENLFQNLADWADYGIIAMMVHKGLWPECNYKDAFGKEAILRVARSIVRQLEQDDSKSCQSCKSSCHSCQ
jgi:hypothetical protein